MSDIVVFDGFSLRSQGPTLTMSLGAGQSMLILGPAASGKTKLLRSIVGDERARQGLVSCAGSAAVAGLGSVSRKTTPAQLGSKFAGKKQVGIVAEALQALRLRNVSDEPILELSPSQRVACELLPVLCTRTSVALIDGQLDVLDPWCRVSALEALRAKQASGTCVIATSNRAELAPLFDTILVMDGNQVKFVGSLEELMRQSLESSVTIESVTQEGVRALVDPFTIRVRETDTGTTFLAEEGQQVAAKLLLEGYGNVRFVVLREPTPEEAVINLVRGLASNDSSVS